MLLSPCFIDRIDVSSSRLGTTGSNKVPELGGPEAELAVSDILSTLNACNIAQKWDQESTNNILFQLNMINPKKEHGAFLTSFEAMLTSLLNA